MGTTSTFFGGSGGGGGSAIPTDIIGTTCNYTWKRDGNVRVHVIGGGGGGGSWACHYLSGGGGGGAGGYARKEFEVVSGETTCLIVGAGGSAVTSGLGCGGVGGCSCLTYNTHTLVANGGGGGGRSCCSNETVPGGCGGTATGGDYNATGGCGGRLICGLNGSSRGFAGGGGAIGFYTNPGYNAGCICCVCDSRQGVSGGAGLGGNGCMCSVSCFSSTWYPEGGVANPGGTAGLPYEVFNGILINPAPPQRPVVTDGTTNVYDRNLTDESPVLNFYSPNFGAGGTAKGWECSGCNIRVISGHGGFGAGGAGAGPGSQNCTGIIAKAGNGGCGGGGGGLSSANCYTCRATGNGGNGVIIIEYL